MALAALSTACATTPKAPPRPIAPSAPRPAPAPSEPPEVVRWAELQHELADALRPGGSCAKVAATMGAFVERRGRELGPAFDALRKWERATPEARVRKFYERHFPAVEVRIDAGERCRTDKAAIAAFDRFFAVAGLDGR